MAKTLSKDDMLVRIARELRVITHGQDLNARYAETIGQEYDALLSEYKRRGKFWWGSDETPLYASKPVAQIMAARMSTQFYSDQAELQKYAVLLQDAEQRLMQIKSDHRPSDEIVHSGYF